jgi:hypothetical protein
MYTMSTYFNIKTGYDRLYFCFQVQAVYKATKKDEWMFFL